MNTLTETHPASLVTYDLTDEDIARTRANYAALEATTPKGYEEVRIAIGVVRATRVGVEKRRVDLKAQALDYGRRVDAEAKRLTALIESIEGPLVAKKQAVDDERARIRAEAEAEKLRAINAQLEAARAAEDARLKVLRDAEDARLATERAALAVERARLADEQREADRLRAVAQAEHEAKRREEERQATVLRASQEATMRAEREALAKERQAIETARQAAERVEFERQATAKAEADALARLHADRVATAEREAKIAALLPDAKKLDAFAAVIRALTPPTVKTVRAKQALAQALQQLETVAAVLTGLEKRA